MKDFIEILDILKITSSTNEKLRILSENKENKQLKEMLNYALNNSITFGVKEFEYTVGDGRFDNTRAWENFKSLLSQLENRELAGSAALKEIKKTFSWFNTQQCFWFEKCLKKDLATIGIGQTLFDKAFGTNNKFKCGLADQEDKIDKVIEEDTGKFIWGYAEVEMKKNGVRTFFETQNDRDEGIIYYDPVGRSGLPIMNFVDIIPFLSQLGIADMMWDGECSVNDCLEDTMTVFGFDFSKTEDDFKGKSGKTRAKAWEKYQADYDRADALRKQLKFTIFACVPRNEWYARKPSWTYTQMRIYLEFIVKPLIDKLNLGNKVEVIDRQCVETYHEARDLANAWIAEGFEGAIVKNPKAVYQFRRCTDWIKIKEEDSFEAIIIGYVPSKTKFNGDGTEKEQMLGAFNVECYHPLSGNLISFEIGTGKLMDENFRIEVAKNPDNWIGKVLECTCQRFTSTSAICPRVERVRSDRVDLDN
jgi:hypothetical protein